MNPQLRALCNREVSAAEIQAVALSEGMQALRQQAWQPVLSGQSTLAEVIRVCSDEEISGEA